MVLSLPTLKLATGVPSTGKSLQKTEKPRKIEAFHYKYELKGDRFPDVLLVLVHECVRWLVVESFGCVYAASRKYAAIKNIERIVRFQNSIT